MTSTGAGGHDGTGKEKYIIMGAAGIQIFFCPAKKEFIAFRDAKEAMIVSRIRQISADTLLVRRHTMRRKGLSRLQRALP